MLLFRSLSVGLLGACVLLLATRRDPRPTRIEHEKELVAVASHAPTIIDVAPNVSATQIAQLVRLAPNERVTAVDDRPVTGNLDAGTVIGSPVGHAFIDLTIAGGSHERRVLVLIH
jgi:hypothetical protein